MNLYVHIPFCSSKCAYCAFASVTTLPPSDFVSTLLRDYAAFSPSSLRSIYIGGGTPSVLPIEQIKQFRHFVPSNFDGEFSVEVNPGSLTLDKAIALRDCGVNRVSVGTQSFDPNVLAFLGRTHSVEDVHSTMSILRKVGFINIGLDLIAAIPNVPRASFIQSVETALSLETQHLSIYTLSVEEGTPFAQRNLQLACAEERLASAGFNRYEISNYAKSGCECAYNLAIWRGEDYLGIGPSASSRLGQCRHTNPPTISHGGRSSSNAVAHEDARPPKNSCVLSEDEDAQERFVTGLRLSEGVRPPETPQGFRWKAALERLIPCGIVKTLPHGRYALTSRGREVADAVMREIAM